MKFLKHPATWAVAAMLPLMTVFSAQAAAMQIDQVDDTTPDVNRAEPTRAAKPKVDKQLVGWNGVSRNAAGERVFSGLRANWVMINASGGLEGQLIGITKPTEVFLLRNGFVSGKTTTDASGQFRLESASPGSYTLVGYSSEAIFSYGFNAIANDGEATNMPVSIQTNPILGAANNRLVAQLIQKNSPQVNFRQYGVYDIGESKDDPAQYYGWDGLRNLTETATPSTTLRAQPIPLGPNGSFLGRIHQVDTTSGRPVEIINTNIMLIAEGEVIGEVQADQSGSFEFTNVEPGSYGIVCSGNDGFAAIGIELVAGGSTLPPSTPNLDADETTSVDYDPLFRLTNHSTVVQDDASVDVTLSSPESMGWINSHVTEQSYVNNMNEPFPEMANMGDMPYNYFDQSQLYGDMGYGGGGAGYGAGFGELILPLGVAAIIATAVDNDNNLNSGIRVISPFDP